MVVYSHKRVSLNTQKSIVSMEPFSYLRCADIPVPSQKLDQPKCLYVTILLSKHVRYLTLLRHFMFPKLYINTS